MIFQGVLYKCIFFISSGKCFLPKSSTNCVETGSSRGATTNTVERLDTEVGEAGNAGNWEAGILLPFGRWISLLFWWSLSHFPLPCWFLLRGYLLFGRPSGPFCYVGNFGNLILAIVSTKLKLFKCQSIAWRKLISWSHLESSLAIESQIVRSLRFGGEKQEL